MREIPPYTNRTGETFSIGLRVLTGPAAADHWQFAFDVRDSKGRSKTFKAYVKKSLYSDPDLAQEFVYGDPLRLLRQKLDRTIDAATDLEFPDSSKGWDLQ